MTQWEYRVDRWEKTIVKKEWGLGDNNDPERMDELGWYLSDEYGREGWEIVSISGVDKDRAGGQVVLKRSTVYVKVNGGKYEDAWVPESLYNSLQWRDSGGVQP